jgi:hypothetical protein
MKLKMKVMQNVKNNRIVLKSTKLITEEDIANDPAWEVMAKEYADSQDSEWSVKAIISIVNSIIYQRRLVFLVTRDSLRDLLNSDKNWVKSIGLKTDNYKFILKILYKTVGELVESFESKRNNRKFSIIKVNNPDILKFLSVNYDEQLKETKDFLESTPFKKGQKNTKNLKEDVIKITDFPQHKEIDILNLAILKIKQDKLKEWQELNEIQKLSADTELTDDNKKMWEILHKKASLAEKQQQQMINDTLKYFKENESEMLQMHEDYAKLK